MNAISRMFKIINQTKKKMSALYMWIVLIQMPKSYFLRGGFTTDTIQHV